MSASKIAPKRFLQNELKEIKGKLRSGPALHTVEYIETKFEQKITDIGKEIKTSIIDELKSIIPGNKTYADATDSPRKTTLKSIIVEARNEEVAEDRDKKRRAATHDVPEST